MLTRKLKVTKKKIAKKKIAKQVEEKAIEVTIKLWLPEHQTDFDEMMNASNYYNAIWDIHNACRYVWKYEDNPSDEKIKLAEEIADICNETNFLDIP